MILGSEGVYPYGSFWLDVADKGIKAMAVMIGAAWTYNNVRRSRTYARKLEPCVTGTLLKKNGGFYVLISCQLKNIGQTKYAIDQKGTYVGAFAISDQGEQSSVLALEIFKAHDWIEPGEQISEPQIGPIPNPKTFIALKLVLRVVSGGKSGMSAPSWQIAPLSIATNKNWREERCLLKEQVKR
jgi:hypothetical protein